MVSTGPMLSIVHDTWRQSRQQVVFIIMLVLLALVSVFFVVFPSSMKGEKGEERFTFITSGEPVVFMELVWLQNYEEQRALQEKRSMDEGVLSAPGSLEERYPELRNTTHFQRSMEGWLLFVASAFIWISVPLFIAACAGYFPNFLSAGSVDVVLAKPVSRAEIFFGKYFGGMALFTASVLGAYLVVFIGIGCRFDIWHFRLFASAPLMLLSAAVLFALLAWVGVRFKSTALSMSLGFVFYYVIDTILGYLQGRSQISEVFGITWLDSVIENSRYVLPNFTTINGIAQASVIRAVEIDWTPILVATGWLALSLGMGYWRFKRTDY